MSLGVIDAVLVQAANGYKIRMEWKTQPKLITFIPPLRLPPKLQERP